MFERNKLLDKRVGVLPKGLQIICWSSLGHLTMGSPFSKKSKRVYWTSVAFLLALLISILEGDIYKSITAGILYRKERSAQ